MNHWIISSYTVKQAAFDLQQKETGSKTVAIATSKYASCGAFLSVQRACQIPIVLHHYLQRHSLFCVLTSMLTHLMTSSVPNLHNTKILNISGTRWDMTKIKCHSSSLLKAFQISLFFNSSVFHFIGTLTLTSEEAKHFTKWSLPQLSIFPSILISPLRQNSATLKICEAVLTKNKFLI